MFLQHPQAPQPESPPEAPLLRGAWRSCCPSQHSLAPAVTSSQCPQGNLGHLGQGLMLVCLSHGAAELHPAPHRRQAQPPAVPCSPAHTHNSVVAIGEAADEAVRVGKLGCSVHLCVRGTRLPEADVLHDGHSEEHWLLQQQPAPQHRALDQATSLPSSGVPSRVWGKHPTAAPNLADEADDLPSQPGRVQGGDVMAV